MQKEDEMPAESGRASAGRAFSEPARAALRFFSGLHNRIYCATDGRVTGRLMGSPVLLLMTTNYAWDVGRFLGRQGFSSNTASSPKKS